MTLTTEFLDEVRSRASLVSVVGRRVKLTRTGAEHSGLCPFHNEKSPSFTVNEHKGFFHCFGCGAHGDVIAFVMRSENRTFMDAVEGLAAEAGLELPKSEPQDPEVAAKRASLTHVLERAAAWYQDQLAGLGGQDGRSYFERRGITPETVAKFRLGWAPAGADALRRALLAEKIPEALLFDAGLIRKRESGEVVDLLRRRVVFPILDGRGRVIAFGGRKITDDDPKSPKYLNSPQTELFDKSATLYGMPFAREGAGRSGTVVVVEGYLDVISTHQAGLDMTVAPLGTALTETHLGMLWKMADVPVMCLDGDAAGYKAMMRAADLAIPKLDKGRGLKFAQMMAGDDPDSLIQRDGPNALRDVIEQARPLSEVVWASAKQDCRPDTPEQLAAFEDRLYRMASMVPDDLIRSRMLGEWRSLLRAGWDDFPEILIGRSSSLLAPAPADDRLGLEWQTAHDRAAASAVTTWLSKHGVHWDALVKTLGGVGLVRGRVVKGKYRDMWVETPRPGLWDFQGEVSLVIIPEWEGMAKESALLDLVAFDPRPEGVVLSTRCGHATVLGNSALLVARGFESRGLTHPVYVAETPLSWLRRKAAGEDVVLVVDWGRAWDSLGGLSQLIAETEELGEKLDRLVHPPKLRRPKIMIEEVA